MTQNPISTDGYFLTVTQVARCNREFDAMAKAQKRVAIAKDVLAYLRAGKIKTDVPGYLNDVDLRNGEQVRDSLQATDRACQACAIGACFVAANLRADDLEVRALCRNGSWDDGMRDYLARWFSRGQLCLIEAAFECDAETAADQGVGDRLARRAEDFGLAHGNRCKNRTRRTRRMRAIMQNIIDNGGTFKP